MVFAPKVYIYLSKFSSITIVLFDCRYSCITICKIKYLTKIISDDDGDDDTMSWLPMPKRIVPAETNKEESDTSTQGIVLHHESIPSTSQATCAMVAHQIPVSETQNPEPTLSSHNPPKRKSQISTTSLKTFEAMKIKILEQLFDHNNKKFELYMKQQKELHELDIAYKKKKIELLFKTTEESDDI